MGGLERSVRNFTRIYRKRGHRVVVVAPRYTGARHEHDVIRVPAIQHFSGTDFSVRLTVPGLMDTLLGSFHPDLVHAHHPFLLGDTALRAAAKRRIPLIFTHHTLFEEYTHVLPLPATAAKRFVIELGTQYANLCDQVFAPSESVAALLRQRGVRAPIAVVPTGVEISRFSRGHGASFRRTWRLPPDAFVIGHLGRLAPEKNLRFLTSAVLACLRREPRAYFLVVGQGPSEALMRRRIRAEGLAGRVRFAGVLQGAALADAYHAMDVFAFASKSETQGLVLVEAMAAGVPVVGLDASGVREVIQDGRNGRLVPQERVRLMAEALRSVLRQTPAQRRAMRRAARETAEAFSMPRCADRALDWYAKVCARTTRRRRFKGRWTGILRRVWAEAGLLKKTAKAGTALVTPGGRRV